MVLFPFNCLTFTFCHFFGESLFTVLPDVTDASRTVRLEQESEDISDKIVIGRALRHILAALSAGIIALQVNTCPDFAPSRLLVKTTTRTLLREIFSTRTTVKTACSDELLVCFNILHIFQVQSPTYLPLFIRYSASASYAGIENGSL